MEPIAARVRRSICRQCPAHCEAFRAGRVDHDDPHVRCPAEPPRWACYGKCGDPSLTRAPAPALRPPVQRTAGHLQRAPSVPLPRKAVHLVRAGLRWIRGGMGIADRAARLERRLICEGCLMWRPAGNAGLGECIDPRCGCSRFKRWLPTETCPQGKWPAAGSRSILRLVWGAILLPLRRVLADLRRPA